MLGYFFITQIRIGITLLINRREAEYIAPWIEICLEAASVPRFNDLYGLIVGEEWTGPAIPDLTGCIPAESSIFEWFQSE